MSILNRIKKRQGIKKKAASSFLALMLSTNLAFAQPTGMTVVNGTATPNIVGSTTTITASDKAILNWNTFNIAAGETTVFALPTATSSVLNRVTGGDPSSILGNLNSNGKVFLINPNGIAFGNTAVVNTHGLVASTRDITDADFLAGNMHFNGSSNGDISIATLADISTTTDGKIWLIAKNITLDPKTNNFVKNVYSPSGQIVLAAGTDIQAIDSGLGYMTFNVTGDGTSTINHASKVWSDNGIVNFFADHIVSTGLITAGTGSLKIAAADTVSITLPNWSYGLIANKLDISATNNILIDGSLSPYQGITSAGADGTLTVTSTNGDITTKGYDNTQTTITQDDITFTAQNIYLGDKTHISAGGDLTFNAANIFSMSGATFAAKITGGYHKNVVINAHDFIATNGMLDPFNSYTAKYFINAATFNNTSPSLWTASNSGHMYVFLPSPSGSNVFNNEFAFTQYGKVYGDTLTNTPELIGGAGLYYANTPILTVGLTGSVTKTYNGNNTATLTGSNYTVSGLTTGDTITLNNPTSGTFDDKNAGTGKTVTSGTLGIASNYYGTECANDANGKPVFGYQLASTTASGNIGTINKANLTAGLTGTVTKTYDGTDTATLTGSNYSLTGVFGTDTVNVSGTATYNDKNAGTEKTVTATGLALTGADAGNYNLISNTAAANIGTINKANITAGLTGTVTKTYDGTDTATLTGSNYSLTGVFGTDTVNVSGTAANYDTPTVGTGKTVTATGLALTGADAGNYNLISTTAAANIGTITATTPPPTPEPPTPPVITPPVVSAPVLPPMQKPTSDIAINDKAPTIYAIEMKDHDGNTTGWKIEEGSVTIKKQQTN